MTTPFATVEHDGHGLTDAQAAGYACVVCGTDFMTVAVPSRPVGHSDRGQVFACTGECADSVAASERGN
jgi:hypothetical protein